MKPSINKDDLIKELKERAKELNCLYETQELLNEKNKSTKEILQEITKIINLGWQFPDICVVRIVCLDFTVYSEGFQESQWLQTAEIKMQESEIIGKIDVFYTQERPEAYKGPFLKEEERLIKTIADQIGAYFFHLKLKSVFEEQKQESDKKVSEWEVIVDMLKKTDPKLLIRISRKMVNYMRWKGVSDAENLFNFFNPVNKNKLNWESNTPFQNINELDSHEIISKIFGTASLNIDNQEILDNISRWIKQDQARFLVDILGNSAMSIGQISNVLERYHYLKKQGLELSPIRNRNVVISLAKRLLTNKTDYIKLTKKYLEIDDYNVLINRTIFPSESFGQIGGKGTGLFLAYNILKKSNLSDDLAKKIKIPKTWYITSDGLLNFMKHNSLEEITEQKYKELSHVRSEYPYVTYVFKNSSFSSSMINSLSSMLDDFGEIPLVVRSTSLLEDQENAVFAGKYKSLFVSNKGTKKERLGELTNAIAEVYASTFGPDPIQYRIEHDLLDENEEMGIMIQEVVGTKVGKYFFPAFAGVAFSKNNYRWTSRIKLNDGLVRMVPGLGTRAVDRLNDDYPVLISPGKPNLRVNISFEEMIKYSPKKIDLINLEERKFETLKIDDLLKNVGKEYPQIHKIVSKLSDNMIQEPSRLRMKFDTDKYIVTFNNLFNNTDFLNQIKSITNVLQTEFEYPIDFEFAHDGTDFYLLQARPQSYSKNTNPAEFPESVDNKKVLFSANKYISNGSATNIKNIVYVDALEYAKITDYDKLIKIGQTIGKLNKLLPKKQFILVGPGRWGSRGDIKLGVRVSYSDINNTAVLIEVARKRNNYVPELSFGTHFFQDLVEAEILYLPLYPDEKNIIFNDEFFKNSKNIFSDLISDDKDLSDVIKVIDIVEESEGSVLNILMNAEKNKALGIIDEKIEFNYSDSLPLIENKYIDTEKHWRWRFEMAEMIATKLDAQKFGVIAFYLFGSTQNATAGPESKIDILIHFNGNDEQKELLKIWLNAWSISLDHFNYIQTGYKIGGCYAMKIDSASNPAKPLKLGIDLNS